MLYLSHLDLGKNELRNAVIQPLGTAPSSPAEGQIYYNTSSDTVFVYANGGWLDLGIQGGAGATNITVSRTSTGITINSDTGTDGALDAADGTNAGVMTSAMYTKLNGIEALADVTDAANVDAAGAVMNSDTSAAGMSFVVDEDNMASDSATKLPTQQSVKAYVDNLLQGLSWKTAVKAASTANVTIASALINGSTIDGVTLATGDRVLLKDQSTASQNGIYVVVASGAASRASDADTAAEITNSAVYVGQGTVNGDTAWTMTTDSVTLGTTSLVYAQINGGTVPSASTSTAGKVQLATSTEAEAKASSTKALTPASVVNFPSKKIFTVGDGSATSIALTHSLGTKEVITQVRRASDDSIVECDIVNTSTSVTTLSFAVAPASNAIKAVVIG